MTENSNSVNAIIAFRVIKIIILKVLPFPTILNSQRGEANAISLTI
ncbi:MAG: hypothetical protein ACJ71K_01290 [Nitrososphaeraceae archaeon]